MNSKNTINKSVRKAYEAKTKKGYWYKCPDCYCPYGNFEDSHIGKVISCACGTKFEVLHG